MLRQHRARERGRVFERVPHHERVGHAIAVVGEHAHAEVVELAERRELLSAPALRDATGGTHVAQPNDAGAVEHRLHDSRVVDRRLGVGHADHRGAAAEGSRARSGLDRLAVFATRLPKVHLDVDESRRDDAARGVEHRRADRRRQRGADLGDHPVDDPHVGHAVAGGVEHPATLNEHFTVRHPALGHPALRHPALRHPALRQWALRIRAGTRARPCGRRRHCRLVR